MSENTVSAALRRMGYGSNDMTGHGFRAMASTLLNELGWKADAIERQLAHAERNRVRASYNHAQLLPERRKMMQAWAHYLKALKRRKVKLSPDRSGKSRDCRRGRSVILRAEEVLKLPGPASSG
jgi:hypothetical protein